jgi:glycosyltransferase involved in cell wall biosynthesis
MAKTTSFAVIIPTYNEEKNIGLLLKDIRKQSVQPTEIIVADNSSKDKTGAIAKKYKAKVVQGGLPGPGRNNGAKTAKSDLFYFIDADARLTPKFFERTLKQVKTRNLDLAAVPFIAEQKTIKYFPVYWIYNSYVRISPFLHPVAGGGCLICKKAVWKRINGFDERLRFCEDNDFTERAVKAGFRYRALRNCSIIMSVRRFEEKGYLKTSGMIVKAVARRYFTGSYHNDPTVYEWGYKKKR